MIPFVRLLSRLSFLLGCLLAIPGAIGLLLILAASQLQSMAVSLEQEAHDRDLYPADLAPESEPR